ncbi:type IV pilin protein [Thiothrix lacustris]|jgi:type IV pilus assembly protein PilE|uniref:Type IV pilin protein n=1 Tax=Thiothrix lacustris TaxID=525917 RepID=A0ABY9MR33_9GAMM|nr:type IV pilin protein [Thiothrix lacustris]WML91121.1 type IV pilin protein [Thiothrix lacustris]
MITIKHQNKGFTLIELMITVAIVGILAAIAYPSYTASVQKSRRADAQVALMEIAQRQESYFLRNRSYGSITALGYSTSSPDGYYTLSINTTGTTGFTATATATASKPQAHDASCQVMTLDDRGAKRGGVSATTTTANTCWK